MNESTPVGTFGGYVDVALEDAALDVPTALAIAASRSPSFNSLRVNVFIMGGAQEGNAAGLTSCACRRSRYFCFCIMFVRRLYATLSGHCACPHEHTRRTPPVAAGTPLHSVPAGVVLMSDGADCCGIVKRWASKLRNRVALSLIVWPASGIVGGLGKEFTQSTVCLLFLGLLCKALGAGGTLLALFLGLLRKALGAGGTLLALFGKRSTYCSCCQ